MGFLNIFRKFPTPEYGKCGGRKRDCSPQRPKDWMDEAFARHDIQLHEASTASKVRRKELKRNADRRLAYRLRIGNPKELSLYGRIYRRLAMLVFRQSKEDKRRQEDLKGLADAIRRN